MATDFEDLLIHPFRELIERGKEAIANAETGWDYDYERSELMLRTARSLMREGERALYRVQPVLNASLNKYGDAFKLAIMESDEITERQRYLEDLLYDIDDFIDMATFDVAKFRDLQAASKSFALTALEVFKRIQVDSSVAPSPVLGASMYKYRSSSSMSQTEPMMIPRRQSRMEDRGVDHMLLNIPESHQEPQLNRALSSSVKSSPGDGFASYKPGTKPRQSSFGQSTARSASSMGSYQWSSPWPSPLSPGIKARHSRQISVPDSLTSDISSLRISSESDRSKGAESQALVPANPPVAPWKSAWSTWVTDQASANRPRAAPEAIPENSALDSVPGGVRPQALGPTGKFALTNQNPGSVRGPVLSSSPLVRLSIQGKLVPPPSMSERKLIPMDKPSLLRHKRSPSVPLNTTASPTILESPIEGELAVKDDQRISTTPPMVDQVTPEENEVTLNTGPIETVEEIINLDPSAFAEPLAPIEATTSEQDIISSVAAPIILEMMPAEIPEESIPQDMQPESQVEIQPETDIPTVSEIPAGSESSTVTVWPRPLDSPVEDTFSENGKHSSSTSDIQITGWDKYLPAPAQYGPPQRSLPLPPKPFDTTTPPDSPTGSTSSSQHLLAKPTPRTPEVKHVEFDPVVQVTEVASFQPRKKTPKPLPLHRPMWFTREDYCDIDEGTTLYKLRGFCDGALAFKNGRYEEATHMKVFQDPVAINTLHDSLCGAALALSSAQHGSFGTKKMITQCRDCEYHHPTLELKRDLNGDPRANLSKEGVLFRLRFLFKSHLHTESTGSARYACVFCPKLGFTSHEGDATVFTTLKALFRHLARHPQPLPEVPGITVLYGDLDDSTPNIDDYDLYFPDPPAPIPISPIEASLLARLPTARAVANHLQEDRKPRPFTDPNGGRDVLEFLEGARIIGVEFPEEWGGKWCTGWHDGVRGAFPAKLVVLEAPPKSEVRLPGTNNDGVIVKTRWKFEPKNPGSGWLAFDKGTTICNVSSLSSPISLQALFPSPFQLKQ
ncbi:hypothetical protein BX600DRAFT_428696 [Xylariales sp. PMI_506]|nr:hypothetical protein BX600DRAFT_428696 [Xylariales sp. PMI_506]